MSQLLKILTLLAGLGAAVSGCGAYELKPWVSP